MENITVETEIEQPKRTIIQQLEDFCTEFCINYCKYSKEAAKAIEKDKVCIRCQNCPVNRFF